MKYSILLLALLSVACDGGKTDESTDTDSTDVTTDTPVETDDPEPTDETDEVTEDPDAACWVDGDAGVCWSCDLPAAAEGDSLKALNRCSSSSYARFDNAARIPSETWIPGNPLPALP